MPHWMTSEDSAGSASLKDNTPTALYHGLSMNMMPNLVSRESNKQGRPFNVTNTQGQPQSIVNQTSK